MLPQNRVYTHMCACARRGDKRTEKKKYERRKKKGRSEEKRNKEMRGENGKENERRGQRGSIRHPPINAIHCIYFTLILSASARNWAPFTSHIFFFSLLWSCNSPQLLWNRCVRVRQHVHPVYVIARSECNNYIHEILSGTAQPQKWWLSQKTPFWSEFFVASSKKRRWYRCL